MAESIAQNAVKQISNHMALLYYYLTKEMISDFGDDAKKTIEKAIIKFGHERGRNIAEKVKAAGEELTIENLDKYYDIPIVAGWSPNRIYEKGCKYNTTESCTFADVWMEKDWAEVGHIYCMVDIAIREGYSEHVIYTPGKNILKGDDCCTSVTTYE
jgi:hypothetical protein